MKKTIILFVLMMLCTCSLGAERMWHDYWFNEGGGTMVLSRGMWPVVATSESTYFSNPLGFTASTSGGYKLIGGPDNQMALIAPGAVKVFKDNQWNIISRPGMYIDAAFDQQGNLHAIHADTPTFFSYSVFTGQRWLTTAVGTGNTYSIAVDPYGAAHFALGNRVYSPGAPGGLTNYTTVAGFIRDLAFTSAGLAGAVVQNNNSVYFCEYNPQQQDWSMDLIATTSGGIIPVELAYDENDNPGVAYAIGNQAYFKTNDGSGSGWETCTLASLGEPIMKASLAFDVDNNPVVCFSSPSETVVQYDPVVPEPMSVMLVLGGVAALRLRKRQV